MNQKDPRVLDIASIMKIHHTTEQCYQLSNLTETKIRKAHLVHFTKGEAHSHHEKRHYKDIIIDVIFGGHVAVVLSNNSRKSYA